MKLLFRFSLLTFIITYFAFSASADIRLPAVISDGMVLQQKSSDPIWGWASPGEQITVKGSWLKGVPVKTKADEKGKWMVKLKTPQAGGPYTITIQGGQTLVLHNVLIGEVWVCSGQSNMEMPVSGWPGASLLNSAMEIKAAKYPDIRLFTVKRDVALQPQSDCTGSWTACTPQTVKTFSATAYFFGRQLYRKLKVPIGLIHTSWGGTVAEAWTSGSALRKLGDFDSALDKLDAISLNVKEWKEKDARNLQTWNQEVNQVNKDYEKENFDASNWETMKLPTMWESAGYPDLDGIVWFRKVVDIPASWAGKDLKLDLGPIDDEDITWFDGEKVGGIQKEGYWAANRSYNIPGKLVKAGRNVISVRVTDIAGNGGIYGDQKLLRLYPSDKKPEVGVSLAGNWKYKIAAKKEPASVPSNPNTPSVLYNAMIAPLIPYGIKGAIWYQGEANVGRAAQYASLFPAMITDWRNRWEQGDFPFYFVQIAPYPYGGNGRQSAALRDAQRRSLRLPNTGMVVTLDIGDTTNIHPANKQEVGRRLSLWALSHAYGRKGLVYSGPLYKGMQIDGNKIVLSFTHTDGGLIVKGGDLTWFRIAGADGDFVPAKAIIKGNTVIVHSDKVAHPKAIHFAWSDKAVPHLFNKAGLPASTFSTEKLK